MILNSTFSRRMLRWIQYVYFHAKAGNGSWLLGPGLAGGQFDDVVFFLANKVARATNWF
jgi:hypothetical protein